MALNKRIKTKGFKQMAFKQKASNKGRLNKGRRTKGLQTKDVEQRASNKELRTRVNEQEYPWRASVLVVATALLHELKLGAYCP